MKSYMTWIIGALCTIFTGWIVADDTVSVYRPDQSIVEICQSSNDRFMGGEVIRYKAYYNLGFLWFHVGDVRFEVAEKADHYVYKAFGHTTASYDWAFTVRDTFVSKVYKDDLLPFYSFRAVHEGSYHRVDEVSYDRVRGIATSNMGKSIRNRKTKNLALGPCDFDLLSAIYAMRNINISTFQEAGKAKISMILDREKYNIGVKYGGYFESKKLKKLGRKDVHVIHPELIVGSVFKGKEGMSIFVSAEDHHVPLLIESPISVGRVMAVYQGSKNLKK